MPARVCVRCPEDRAVEEGDMTGQWTIPLEDGAHSLYATASYMTGQVTVRWDETLLDSSIVAWLSGDIRTFRKNGHVFVLSIRGPWYFGHLVLSMDGRALRQVEDAGSFDRPEPAPRLQFMNEQNVVETEEVVAVDDFPLDNSFGGDTFVSERQVSRESTIELTVGESGKASVSLGVDLFQTIKSEVAAEVSRQTGSRVGARVTETQTLKFTVGPNRRALYRVTWKRKVRTGERVYLAAGGSITVPYRLEYGLKCEMRTVDPRDTAAAR
jgi:hypothetical protein